jgi:hypothetical protein
MSPGSAPQGARVWLWVCAALAACSATAPPPHPNWTAAEIAAEQRCQAGEIAGCGDSGRSLLLANRSQREVEHALVLLEGACGGGDLPSCVTLGSWYRADDDNASQARSRELLMRACNGGLASACPPAPKTIDDLDSIWDDPSGPCCAKH